MTRKQPGKRARGGRRPAATERERRRARSDQATAPAEAPPAAQASGVEADAGVPAENAAAADSASFLIAGVGMSAGGLEACREMLEALPADPGLAIVLIPHLAPHQRSALPSLLAERTKVPVVQAADEMTVSANRVYVIPPDAVMELTDAGLRLSPRSPVPGHSHPVDAFFSSLASVKGDSAVGVILSGTGSDGAQGVRNIKQHGGTVIAQQPDTARYDGMPHAAIETGTVDLVLPAAEIGPRLAELARIAYALPRAEAEGGIPDAQFQELVEVLRGTSGVDFAHYKQPTMRRRILRRMAFHHFTDPARYLAWVKTHSEEARALYQDILIHVTRFFRDPESFDALATVVLPKLLEGRRPENPIRIWVAGCATGEEAYSIAMTLFEAAGEVGTEPNFQLFGTDVSDTAVDFARQGLYAATIAEDVGPARLRRFFTNANGGYRISKLVRDHCVFARQDLTRDPPFSRLDLIICRNVLTYMDAALQRKVMAIFHYALRPTGYLMLGQAETTGSQTEFFTLAEKKHRIFRRRDTDLAPAVTLNYPLLRPHSVSGPSPRDLGVDARAVQNEANRTLLDRYGPPGVLVNDVLEIVQFRGHTGPFLEPPPGEANLNLLKLAREGLLHGLRAALQAARKTKRPVRKEGLRVRSNGGWIDVDLEVMPLLGLPVPHFLVMFDQPRGPARSGRPARGVKAPEKDHRRVERLEEELVSTREYLQSIIQEVEAANEELQSANEEILSSNEELQSTNEELDTAKEELQSTNEELNTLNEELHTRNEELTRVNSDLVNLLANVQIAIVIVSTDLRIRRFTPMAEKTLNLIPADVGRPISQVKPNINVPHLDQLIADVIDKVEPIEREVTDAEGRWYLLRIRPYKAAENRIDGAVVALFDIDSAKREEADLGRRWRIIKTVVDAIEQPMAILDASLRVRSSNRAFSEAFNLPERQPEGRFIYDLAGDGSLGGLRDVLEGVVRDRRAVEGAEVRQSGDAGSETRTLVVKARPLERSEYGDPAVLVVFQLGTGQPA